MNDLASQVIQGDCLAVLPTLSSASVDAVITDPPYLGRYKNRWGRALANDDKRAAVVEREILSPCGKPTCGC